MKHWSIVQVEVDHRCFAAWSSVVKKLRDVLKQHDVPFTLQAAAHFVRKAKPIKVWTTAAVVAICDFLYAYGIRFQIHEVTPFSLADFRDKYRPAEQTAVPA